jgi:mono/diheme cytochrome c family protein
MRKKPGLMVLLFAFACESEQASGPDAGPADARPLSDAPLVDPGEVPASEQRPGDPEAGYRALVNYGYVGCGMPLSLFRMFFGSPGPDEQLPGREGLNTEVPFMFNAFTVASGVDVVWGNCLGCHAGRINGELVIGLGAADVDFTQDLAAIADLAGAFVSGDAERAEWRKWANRMQAIGPYTITPVIGVNPADSLGLALFAHHDQETLAWSEEWLMERPPPYVVPVDVPPWWRMQKKHGMFYNGMGRGDHARIMMSASTFCIDSIPEAEAVDAYFPDVRAYLLTLQPPEWPFQVDDPLAEAGKAVFERECASCHGTYGEPAAETYPNLVVALEEVGTDPLLAVGTIDHASRFVNWFNGSFYGRIATLLPAAGYYAPPLDGIWATAPYLHNGSVPTLAALLDSDTRPRYWTRTFDSTDYDPATVGWTFVEVDHGHAEEPNEDQRKRIYDTTLLGYSNAGHAFGDALEAGERAALLEYLKTI